MLRRVAEYVAVLSCEQQSCPYAGLAAARARGRVGGRPTVWTDEKRALARTMYESREHDVSMIARILGVSRASVYRLVADH